MFCVSSSGDGELEQDSQGCVQQHTGTPSGLYPCDPSVRLRNKTWFPFMPRSAVAAVSSSYVPIYRPLISPGQAPPEPRPYPSGAAGSSVKRVRLLPEIDTASPIVTAGDVAFEFHHGPCFWWPGVHGVAFPCPGLQLPFSNESCHSHDWISAMMTSDWYARATRVASSLGHSEGQWREG